MAPGTFGLGCRGKLTWTARSGPRTSPIKALFCARRRRLWARRACPHPNTRSGRNSTALFIARDLPIGGKPTRLPEALSWRWRPPGARVLYPVPGTDRGKYRYLDGPCSGMLRCVPCSRGESPALVALADISFIIDHLSTLPQTAFPQNGIVRRPFCPPLRWRSESARPDRAPSLCKF